MSTLIGLKLNDAVVLATDSLLYNDEGRVFSRTQQKIIEVAPGVFYGWSGRKALAIQQANIAVTLSRTAQPRNLCAFAEELNAASMPCIAQAANRALVEQIQPTVSGELPFFIYILAGVSEGVPGFLVCQFSLRNSEVYQEMVSYFEPTTGDQIMNYITGDESLIPLMNNPKSWESGLTGAAERFVDHLRLVQPTYVGGPTQMACIDKSGARWVHEPVELHRGVAVDGAPGTEPDTKGGVQARVSASIAVNASNQLTVKAAGVLASMTNLAAINAATGAVNANHIVDAMVTSPAAGGGVNISKLIAGTNIFTGEVYLSRGSGYPVIALRYDGVTLFGQADGSGVGLTSKPYVRIQYNGVLVHSGVNASVLIDPSGVTLWSVNGNTTYPYALLTSASLLFKHGTASVTISATGGVAIVGGRFSLDLNGVVTTIDNAVVGGSIGTVGFICTSAGTNTSIGPGVIVLKSGAGLAKASLSAGGTISLVSSSGATCYLAPDSLTMTGLLSSYPGAGSKSFWWDPADGNRVKFAA